MTIENLDTLSESDLLSRLDKSQLPKHLAIIMDGNGRWAAKRHLPRISGHKEGIVAVRKIVTCARQLGIRFLTLYAFSSENWNRPTTEVSQLMRLLGLYLKKELKTLMADQICLKAIGQTDRLPKAILELLLSVSEQTRDNNEMTLTLALSYSGRGDIVDAVRHVCNDVQNQKIAIGDLSETVFSNYLHTKAMPDPDLMIRTSGEIRISNFFLWQLAYTELYFTKTFWPDFGRKEFLLALLDYQARERRFGGVPAPTEAV
jgi:undecaprenyl diphosphate synthase